jgi:putative SOS response-associated peptidase YedK
MSERYAQTSSPEALSALLGAEAAAELKPRYNIAPTQDVPVVLIEDGARRIVTMRWGLPPLGETAAPAIVNARAETLAQKPAFRTALQRRRCLVPADAWYEWRTIGRFRQPYLIRRLDRAPMMFAGVWDAWSRPDGATLTAVALVTVPAKGRLAGIHERAPAALAPAHWDAWLDVTVDGSSLALRCMAPPPDDEFEAIAIGARINQIGNDGPEVQEAASEHAVAPDHAQPRLV